MQVNHIKSYALIRLKYFVMIIMTLSILNGFLISYKVSNINSEKEVKSQALNLKNSISITKQKLEEANLTIQLWKNEVNKVHSIRSGIRVGDFKVIINELSEKYKLNNLTIDFKAPELRNDMKFNKFIDIEYTSIRLSFSAPLDTFAYMFLDDLLNDLPGYPQIKDVSFIAVTEINDELINSFYEGKKEDIVNVKTEILWQDFKDKKSIQATKKAELEKWRDKNKNYLLAAGM